MIYFLHVEKDCVYCKGTIKDNDILIGLCKTPLHISCSKRSRKLFIAQVGQVQDEFHASFVAKARVALEKSAAICKAVPVDLLGSDARKVFVL